MNWDLLMIYDCCATLFYYWGNKQLLNRSAPCTLQILVLMLPELNFNHNQVLTYLKHQNILEWNSSSCANHIGLYTCQFFFFSKWTSLAIKSSLLIHKAVMKPLAEIITEDEFQFSVSLFEENSMADSFLGHMH